MSGFDQVVMVDWSARSAPSPAKPTKDAIFIGVVSGEEQIEVQYHRTRHAAMGAVSQIFDRALSGDRRVLAGFDFPFGYPHGFARAVTGCDNPFALWADLAERIEDGPDNRNNRFDVAETLNGLFPGLGPFWGCPPARESAALPARGSLRHGHGLPERRLVERRLPRAQPSWKLFTTGSVGSQVLLGLPHLHELRMRYGDNLAVSPFQSPDTPIVLAEIYPGLIDAAIKARVADNEILDAAQVRLIAQVFARLPPDRLDVLLREGDREEGWILGLGAEAELEALL
ncbi:molybdopterin guanine dinucleotide synthesis [Gymnodinialimonas sp. 2305UL16-5]|uniref:molybdopterin guanine dinucleotide synthesis n=1 Tax=Gymnodinialimonas mytili TaxID=3126503 RepID=UPI0030A3BE84